jgi:hypothetical protein
MIVPLRFGGFSAAFLFNAKAGFLSMVAGVHHGLISP